MSAQSQRPLSHSVNIVSVYPFSVLCGTLAMLCVYLLVCLRVSDEVQRRVTALEEARRQMEEEHAQQLSLLLAEQEKEQQRLRQVSTCNCSNTHRQSQKQCARAWTILEIEKSLIQE